MKKPEQSGQIAAWADEWHGDLVQYLARRTGSAADAQDLAQEVYLRLLRFDGVDLIRKPRSYLLRIAANLLHEWRLKARQSYPHDPAELDLLITEENPESAAARGLRARRLVAELDRLSPTMRIALVLQVRDGLSYDEIATRMNVTPRMVKRYLLEGYARLRERLPREI